MRLPHLLLVVESLAKIKTILFFKKRRKRIHLHVFVFAFVCISGAGPMNANMSIYGCNYGPIPRKLIIVLLNLEVITKFG